ncbi:MAG: cytochrome c [Cytophagales bacterium]|nr:cytochrome c [Cytophagales bacterium]
MNRSPLRDISIRTLKVFFPSILFLLCGCAARGDKTGIEFAPQMYHSVPYEPLSQVKDPEAGRWLSSTGKEHDPAEFYNGNPYHVAQMSMREPVEGTVPYLDTLHHLPKTVELKWASENLKSPFQDLSGEEKEEVLQEAQVLYQRFCTHCHGDRGKGDGKVGKVYKGVPSYSSRAIKGVNEAHIFHVISYGKGRMKAHHTQLSPEERWKIAHYVKTLQ